MKHAFTLFAAALAANAAFAQDAYKCSVNGKYVIQDSPCKVSAPSGPFPNSSEEAAAIEAGKALCKERAPRAVSWKDPESVRIGEVVPGKVVDVNVDGTSHRARYFTVRVNAKNSYGGYVGEKPMGCYVSVDGTRIVKVSTLLMD